jgi:phage antirepressor YoqD-like protein
MNDLTLFKSENFYNIECDFWKNEQNEIFMTGHQLGTVLGYIDPAKSIRKTVERNEYLKSPEFSGSVKMTSPSGTQDTRIFTEDGIYEITLLAKTDKAKEFRSWVRKILKVLRKHEIETLQKQLDGDKPKLELYNQVMSASNYMTMLQVSKILKVQGRNKLFRFLRSENVLMNKGERHNLPYQQFCDNGLFTVVLKPMLIGREIIDMPITLVSIKGIEFIQKRLKKKDLLPQVKN